MPAEDKETEMSIRSMKRLRSLAAAGGIALAIAVPLTACNDTEGSGDEVSNEQESGQESGDEEMQGQEGQENMDDESMDEGGEMDGKEKGEDMEDDS
ncbi:hypothetical protein GCM10009799_12630 [Nocardiopsis rhodophaea]|uniref:Uncharacterized protein n=1 Tax=Nocardiopsis rhodophaea TaxID=280238 RepID=A0ABN2SKP8_9ACTN